MLLAAGKSINKKLFWCSSNSTSTTSGPGVVVCFIDDESDRMEYLEVCTVLEDVYFLEIVV